MDFMEVLILFGYASLFSCIVPLVAVLAFANVVLDFCMDIYMRFNVGAVVLVVGGCGGGALRAHELRVVSRDRRL